MPVVSVIGSASMSARRPITLPLPLWRPRMTPTTPVRPMPVATSSRPNARSLFGDGRRRAVDVVEDLGMAVEVAAPGDDVVVEIGETVDDRHSAISVAAATIAVLRA